ncbi:hypothetical protein DPMN_097532 [Dreissena polymorpha]|uniref:Uncharacterized protein n=1 Tax=Dreissena polymorpha TaxID=45954 RepID=A0A9D4LBY8_DREPO|nr:hypothetical protein DPMN_097532 [Dreissena polymorpha]
MATLEVTGRRLHPRDGFPSTLSVLSTAVPGSLYRATPSMFMGLPPFKPMDPGPSRMSPTLVVSLSRRTRPSTDGTSGLVRAGELSTINSGLVRSAASWRRQQSQQ